MKEEKSERILDALSQVRENYIEESAPSGESVRTGAPARSTGSALSSKVSAAIAAKDRECLFSGLQKGLIAAACLCLVVGLATAIGVHLSKTASPSEQTVSDAYTALQKCGITADVIESPASFSVTGEHLLDFEAAVDNLLNGDDILVLGTVTDAEYLRVGSKLNNQFWYIICLTISVDEVLRGDIDSEEVRIASLSARSIPNYDEADNYPFLCSYQLNGCGIGTEGVFCLQAIDSDTQWFIKGNEIPADTFGDYFLSARYYEKDGTLHFAGFNADLGVALEDLRKKEK